MEILWAPWRIQYIERPKEDDSSCIFCTKPAENRDEENLILYRGKHNFIIMNRYPYNNAHLLIVPYQHTNELSDLNDEEKLEMMDLLVKCKEILTDSMGPHGFNIGMNLGTVGGAGVKDHLHFHIVPRWNGDTNFMPVIGNTDVISEGLERTWSRLREKFDQLK